MSGRDFILQLDSIGNTLNAWAWLPGDAPDSEEPMVTASVGVGPGVSPTLGVFGSDSESTATFRWFAYSSDHISVTQYVVPEPSSAMLVFLGFAGLLSLRRKNQQD